MSRMTLEEVRDALLTCPGLVFADGADAEDLADAISAYLSQAGEPYGYLYWHANGDGTRSEEFARKLPSRYCADWGFTVLYTTPPSDKGAQVDEQPSGEPVARLRGVDEHGPMLDWHKHWGDLAVGTKLYTAPRPAVATAAEVTDEQEDAAFDDGEQVAQWLYRKGMRNAAFVVRGQLDVRNNRIRKLEDALAQPRTAGVPEGWELVPVVPTTAMLEASAVEWTGLCHGYAPQGGHFEFMTSLWNSMLAAAPEVSK